MAFQEISLYYSIKTYINYKIKKEAIIYTFNNSKQIFCDESLAQKYLKAKSLKIQININIPIYLQLQQHGAIQK